MGYKIHSLLIPAGLTIMLGVMHIAYCILKREEVKENAVAETVFRRHIMEVNGKKVIYKNKTYTEISQAKEDPAKVSVVAVDAIKGAATGSEVSIAMKMLIATSSMCKAAELKIALNESKKKSSFDFRSSADFKRLDKLQREAEGREVERFRKEFRPKASWLKWTPGKHVQYLLASAPEHDLQGFSVLEHAKVVTE